jgi:hypothetical protein
MEGSPNGSNNDAHSDIRDRARELFERISIFLEGGPQTSEAETITLPCTTVTEPCTSEADTITVACTSEDELQTSESDSITVPCTTVTQPSEIETDVLSHEEGWDRGRAQQHLISSVVFRSMRHGNGDEWDFESSRENMDIADLDKVGLADDASNHGIYNDDQNDLKIAMTENIDTVLLRGIFDWSRPDGNVWSQQIVWNGSFADSQRLVQLMEVNSPSIEVRTQHFDLHTHLRELFIARHASHPIAAAISAVESSPTVIISEEQVRKGENEGLMCAICHDMFSIGESVKQLRCSHFYHEQCMFQWFYLRLQCPLCRDEFQ